MKILYDHQIFTAQKYGGISRYFTEIISNLPRNINTEIAIKYSNNEYIHQFGLLPNLQKLVNPIDYFFPGVEFTGKTLIFNLLNRFNPFKAPNHSILNKDISIKLLKEQNFDIFHPTYYDDYFLNYIGNKPFVLTIYDMIHELYPEMLQDTNTIINKANLSSKASHIIAISEQTKSDIIDILNIKEDKITVTHLASSMLKNTVENKLELPDSYLLFVGNRSIYKNFNFFALAVQSVLMANKDLKVVCTGNKFNKYERELLRGLKIEDRFIDLFVREDQFYQVYHNAKAFIFPSYYEGFGIPILESFAAECPVILSNSSCLPEIAGDAALFFNPKSKKELIYSLELLLSNDNLKTSLVEKGKERLKNYSWEKTAKKTLEIYDNVLKNKIK